MSWTVETYDHVTSTMQVALERAQHGAPEGTTIVAREQTAGRGRRGRVWVSPPGSGLYCTVLLRPPARPDLHTLSLVVAAAVAKTLHDEGVQDIGLKWPNDVLASNSKIAGILLEAEQSPSGLLVLAGIGINLEPMDTDQVPRELREGYATLADAAGREPRIEEVLEHLLGHLQSDYQNWLSRGLLDALETWRDWDVLCGRPLRAYGLTGPVQGLGAGINADGALVVETSQGLVSVTSGEVIRVRPA